MVECGIMDKVKSITGFTDMKLLNTKVIQGFQNFIHTDNVSLLAGGSYGAANGVQGYSSVTGRVIQDRVQTDAPLFYVDMYWMYVTKCNDFDAVNGSDLWKAEACIQQNTFKLLLVAMFNILECIIDLRMLCKPKGGVVFACLGEAVATHWGPLGDRLMKKHPKYFVMSIFPFHPCRYHSQAPPLQDNFKLVASEIKQMLNNFIEGIYQSTAAFSVNIEARKTLRIKILTELCIPHNNGWLSVKLRVLRNMDLITKQPILLKMLMDLNRNVKLFVQLLELPGLIRRVCCLDGYVDILMAFIQGYGVKESISLFRSNCFASRITEQSYMDIFLAFVKDFGVKDSIAVFRSTTIACRLNNENFISRLMYCIQSLKDSNCRGIITQFKVIAPYYELLSENFYESLIKSESGWSESLCKKFVKNINVGDNKLVDDRVWKKVLDDRSEYQKRLTRQLCAKQLLPPPPTTCPYCFTKFGEHMGATLRIMHIDGKLCKDIKQR